MAKLQLPKGMTSVSHAGQQYDANKRGIVDVPDDAVPDLVVFGAVGVNEPAQQSPDKPQDSSPDKPQDSGTV